MRDKEYDKKEKQHNERDTSGLLIHFYHSRLLFPGPFGYTTARTLLGILRISQAMARIRFSDEVTQADVEEAMHLMRMCQEHLRHSKEQDRSRANLDPSSDIFHMIKELGMNRDPKEVGYDFVI